jgi:phosphonoacetate hydrolase
VPSCKEADQVFEVVEVTGRNPLGNQDPACRWRIEEQLADPHPPRARNSYPYAFENIAQLYRHPCAPDLCVIHSPAHNWEERGGHAGEHGSLDVVQSRAPLIAAGAGIAANGLIPTHCRLLDVAPTVLSVLGVPRPEEGLEGRAVSEVLSGERASLVVGFLLDGTNSAVLYDMVARGELPVLAELAAKGTTLAHGAFACLPSVTVPNHTTIQTGLSPGSHGVLHNSWYDRTAGRRVVTESPTTWHLAMEWLKPGVRTVHDMVKDAFPGAFTAAVNDMADKGADYSTFDFFRRGEIGQLMAMAPSEPPRSDPAYCRELEAYKLGSVVDELAVRQVEAILKDHLGRGEAHRLRYLWVSFALTDAAFHAGGPLGAPARAALRDTDARIGAVLELLEQWSLLQEAAFLVVADHGMEQSDPATKGDWDEELTKAGVDFRDESYGFIYLGG